MTVLERFEQKYIPEPMSGCWIWLGALTDLGYGNLRYGPRKMWSAPAHVISYELFIGPVPDGKELDHRCRMRCCVNPNHVEPVTHRMNMERGINATKTHCKHGHEFTEDNILWLKGPFGKRRQCRTCANIRNMNYRRGLGIPVRYK